MCNVTFEVCVKNRVDYGKNSGGWELKIYKTYQFIDVVKSFKI